VRIRDNLYKEIMKKKEIKDGISKIHIVNGNFPDIENDTRLVGFHE